MAYEGLQETESEGYVSARRYGRETESEDNGSVWKAFMAGTDSAFRRMWERGKDVHVLHERISERIGEQIVGVTVPQSVEQFVALVDVSFLLIVKER